jgi:hypothetical protein
MGKDDVDKLYYIYRNYRNYRKTKAMRGDKKFQENRNFQ